MFIGTKGRVFASCFTSVVVNVTLSRRLILLGESLMRWLDFMFVKLPFSGLQYVYASAFDMTSYERIDEPGGKCKKPLGEIAASHKLELHLRSGKNLEMGGRGSTHLQACRSASVHHVMRYALILCAVPSRSGVAEALMCAALRTPTSYTFQARFFRRTFSPVCFVNQRFSTFQAAPSGSAN